MKIVFIGWNENGEKCLSILIKNNLKPESVFLPRDYKVTKMVEICKKDHVKFFELNRDLNELEKRLKKVQPDLLIVASFPILLPQNILNIPRYGSINVHAGLLPKYRGYHPINWAIIKDEGEIGVTVHYIDEGMDTGDILAQESIEVKNTDDVITLRNKLTSIGASLLLKVVKNIRKEKRRILGKVQKNSEAIFAPRRFPNEGLIKWLHNSREIFNLIRALKTPYPNAFSFNSKGEKVEFRKSFISKIPGKILAKINDYYLISTGDGVILVKTNKVLRIGEILRDKA